MFSHSGAYNGSAAVVIDEQPVTPVLAISTHPQLARDDSIGWLGGRPYYGTGAKSALSDCFVFSWTRNLFHFKTRKRSQAQLVARPAHANATVHFLLTYRQATASLPPSEWRLKNQPIQYLAMYRLHLTTHAHYPAFGRYRTTVHEIFTRRRGINIGVNATTYVVILSSVVNASAQNEDGVCQFSLTRDTNRLL